MPVARKLVKKVEIPDGVKVELKGNDIIVTGDKEAVTRSFEHPRIRITIENGSAVVSAEYPSKADMALLGTITSHIRNMVRGVSEGFQYKMKIVYSHFPIKVSVRGQEFVVENFLGERSPRIAKILGKTHVEVKGDEVVLTGPNIEDVGQSAANIEQVTRIKGYDPRVFQDGVYIVQKRREE
ncbi:MAG: 50S ribosomal protein L6 [Thermoplasmata archaeon]